MGTFVPTCICRRHCMRESRNTTWHVRVHYGVMQMMIHVHAISSRDTFQVSSTLTFVSYAGRRVGRDSQARRSSGEKPSRRSWIPDNEETSFERVGIIRAENFAAARATELEAASATMPVHMAPSAARLARIGAPPVRMRLRRRAASFRPYKMPLFVRLNPRKKRKLPSEAGVRVPCRASRRAVRHLAARQRTLMTGDHRVSVFEWEMLSPLACHKCTQQG